MDDLQFWLYVIIGVIYLISQVRKKSKQRQDLPRETTQPGPVQSTSWPQETAAQPESHKPISFEELLREITQEKTKREVSYDEAENGPDYDDFAQEEETALEKSDFDYRKTDPIYNAYESAKARDYTSSSLEETMKLEDVKMDYGKFKEFEIESRSNLLERYTLDLQYKDGLKKAFVLTEILKPRYF